METYRTAPRARGAMWRAVFEAASMAGYVVDLIDPKNDVEVGSAAVNNKEAFFQHALPRKLNAGKRAIVACFVQL